MDSERETKTYHQNFTHYQKIFEKNRQTSIPLFLDDIQIIEERIGFQFSLHEAIAKILNEQENMEKLIKKPITQNAKLMLGSLNMFQINNKNLYAAYESTLFDFSTSTYATLRIVFETIMLMYYMIGHPEHLDLLVEYMKIKGDIKQRKLLRQNKFEKFKPGALRKSLYIDERLKSIENIYQVLSYSVHPAIYEMNAGSIDPNSKRHTKDMLWYNKLLSFYNIHVILECFSVDDKIWKRIFSPEIVNYLNRCVQENSENGGMSDFFPNKKEIKDKFKIYSDLCNITK